MSRKYLGFSVLGENLTVDTKKLVKKVVSVCFAVADKSFECLTILWGRRLKVVFATFFASLFF